MSPEKEDKNALENKRLNPQCRTVEIGVRHLREVTIYPLSLKDEKKLVELFTDAMTAIMNLQQQPDVAVASWLVTFISENLETLTNLVMPDENGTVTEEITNLQAAEIAEIIYETNFEPIVKKVQSLSGKINIPSLTERQSRRSSKTTDSTGSKTSSKKRSKKGESREDR